MKKDSAPKRIRRLAVVTLVLAVLGAFAYVAYERVRALAPARLRAEVEGLLARETRGPVEIGALQLVWGLPLELHGAGLRLYDGALKFVGLHALFLLTVGEVHHLDEGCRHVGAAQYAHRRLVERPRPRRSALLELFFQHGRES